ncbi:GNAT family N-acetyltransferase [Roseateles saccharophilus]|uniref:Acetyltransferase (GNAT) family protein n=1 Tax=Roseateles saccharophilus TaxID=304 RepID=A0A4R3UFA3_ROSSA|nr:GNAT family N-acetyltransferase [Roseateles saccharophilus]MDG0834876.1 N-acetyltransferase [Roseateles saccharophilus]TCU88407.1 acetyltransferase (GNAT) family protein [Roseateles saccharophilus]
MSEPEPPLIDIPERLDGERTMLLAPRAGLGAEMAVVIAQSLSHLRPWMIWAQQAPTAESAELVVRRMMADFIARRDLCWQIYARRADGSPGRMLGGTGLHRIDWEVRKFEIGYWIRPDATGRGACRRVGAAAHRPGLRRPGGAARRDPLRLAQCKEQGGGQALRLRARRRPEERLPRRRRPSA